MIETKQSGLKLIIPSIKEGINFGENLNLHFFPSHFLSIIIGKPGDGKTSLLKTMLKEDTILFKKFDHVLILSPSIIEYNDLFLPKSNLKSEMDFDWIIEKISSFDSKKYINVLLILDDFVSEIKDSELNVNLKKILFNRRHLIENGMVSIIITTQKYKSIPTVIRAIINHIIFFRLNPSEEDAIQDEQIHDTSVDFKSITKFVFGDISSNETQKEQQKNNFLIYNKAEQKLFKNFDIIVFK